MPTMLLSGGKAQKSFSFAASPGVLEVFDQSVVFLIRAFCSLVSVSIHMATFDPNKQGFLFSLSIPILQNQQVLFSKYEQKSVLFPTVRQLDEIFFCLFSRFPFFST